MDWSCDLLQFLYQHIWKKFWSSPWEDQNFFAIFDRFFFDILMFLSSVFYCTFPRLMRTPRLLNQAPETICSKAQNERRERRKRCLRLQTSAVMYYILASRLTTCLSYCNSRKSPVKRFQAPSGEQWLCCWHTIITSYRLLWQGVSHTDVHLSSSDNSLCVCVCLSVQVAPLCVGRAGACVVAVRLWKHLMWETQAWRGCGETKSSSDWWRGRLLNAHRAITPGEWSPHFTFLCHCHLFKEGGGGLLAHKVFSGRNKTSAICGVDLSMTEQLVSPIILLPQTRWETHAHTHRNLQVCVQLVSLLTERRRPLRCLIALHLRFS